MPFRTLPALTLALCSGFASGDDLDHLDGKALAAFLASPEARPVEGVGFRELGTLPALVAGTRTPVLVATTDRGNPVCLLVSPAFRLPAEGKDAPNPKPSPILILERFATFDAADLASRVTVGENLILFEGFRVDLDSGTVVPDGQGGDLQFLAGDDAEGLRLVPLAGAKMYVPDRSSIPSRPIGRRPSAGRAFVPADFGGRFRIYADGRWSGLLELDVQPEGTILGRFRSDLNGTAYPVTGRLVAEVPGRIRFDVAYPRSRQVFEGHLWGDGKGAIAGTGTFLDRPFGFFAVREGGRIAPDGVDVPTPPGPEDRPFHAVVAFDGGNVLLDGEAIAVEDLEDELRDRRQIEPGLRILVRPEPETPYRVLALTLEAVRTAGVETIRMASPPDPARP